MAIVSDHPSNAVSPDQALALFRQQQARQHAAVGIRTLVGASPAIVRARAQVVAAIASRANTLVTGGESSSLAEVALAIHHGIHAGGKGGLYRLRAGDALPSEVARAASSLARDDQGGTLLIESIDHLTADTQANLLSIVGTPTWRGQIIATRASADIETVGMSDELVAVVSTLVVDLPRLADRPEDIPLLVDHCLAELSDDTETEATPTISAPALDALMVYPWPGELPELTEVLERAAARAGRRPIEPRDLPRTIHHAVDQAALATDRPEPINLDDYLAQVESALALRALELADGNKAEAARLLGISRPRLYRKLEQMGLVEPAPTSAPPQPKQPKEPEAPVAPAPATSDEGIEFLPVEGDE